MKKKLLYNFKILLILANFICVGGECNAQYCTPYNSAGQCASNDLITRVEIAGTYLDNHVSGCNANQSRTISYPAVGNYTTTLFRTPNHNTYTINVTSTNSQTIKFALWIDYNQNNVFDSIEWTKINYAGGNYPVTATFTVPKNAKLGKTGMRVKVTAKYDGNEGADACSYQNIGMTHDYIVTIDTFAACSGTPTAGNISTSTDSVCSGTSIILNSTGLTSAGLTFQWQSSTDSMNWSDIANDTTPSISSIIYTNTYFRFYTTCNGNSDTSSIKLISLNGFNNCYCIPYYNTACSNTDIISGVTIKGTTLNNIVNTCNNQGTRYFKYPANKNTTATLYIDSSKNNYKLSVTTTNNDYKSVWIDFDHNGSFDSIEQIDGNAMYQSANNGYVFSFSVPTNSILGFTTMRIRTSAYYFGIYNDKSGCMSLSDGVTHDYSILIDSLPICSGNIKAGYVLASDNEVCKQTNVLFTCQGNTNAMGQTFQWQSSSDGINWKDISGDTNLVLLATVNAKSYYRYYTVCNGTYSDTSTKSLVQLKPFTACYCVPRHPVCSYGDAITNVNIKGTTLNNSPSPCPNGPNGPNNPYYIYPAKGNTTTYLQQGKQYKLSVTTNIDDIISVWLDYDRNGTFDSAEWTQVCSTSVANVANTVNITIPSSTASGMIGMRIRSRNKSNINAAINACTLFGSGQTHDYIISIGTPPSFDVGIAAVKAPANQACYSAAEPVSLVIQNFGIDTINMSNKNVKVHIDVSGGSTISLDTVIKSGKIAPNATMNITFAGTVDLSKSNTTYNFLAYTTSGDSNAINDSNNFTIQTALPQTLDYIENFDTSTHIATSYNAAAFSTKTFGYGNYVLALDTNSYVKTTGVNTPIVGPLTSISAFKFSYANPARFSGKDSVVVYLTFDCGKTFIPVITFDSSNTGVKTFRDFTYNLGAYTGSNVAAAFVSYNNSSKIPGMYFDTIVIAEKPKLNLGNDTTTCNNYAIDATPKYNYNNCIYSWSDGSTLNMLVADTNGTYSVKLTDKTTGLYSIDSIKVTINKNSINLGSAKNVCLGTKTILNAGNFGSGTTYLWNTGDTTQTISVTTAGTYFVKVVGGTYGCEDTGSITLGLGSLNNSLNGISLIKGTNSKSKFNKGTASNPDAVCVGNYASYELKPSGINYRYDNSYYGTNWKVSSFSMATASGNKPTKAYFLSPYNFANAYILFEPYNAEADSIFIITMTIVDLANGCDTTVVRYIKVMPAPIVSLGSDQIVCPGKPVVLKAGKYSSYLWSEGSTGPSIGTAKAGPVWVKVTDANGCSNSDTMILNNYIVTKPNLGPDTKQICPGSTINLDAGNFLSYLWDTGDTTRIISVNSKGSYEVAVKDSNSCITKDTIYILFFPTPFVNLGADKGICPASTIKLDAGIGDAYVWNTGDTTQTITINKVGSYFVNKTDTNGCNARDTINISQVANPDASFSYAVSGSYNNIQFTANDSTVGNNYTWDFGDTYISTLQKPLHLYAALGSYNVKLMVTNSNNCVDLKNQTTIVSTAITSILSILNNVSIYPNPYSGSTNLNYNIIEASQILIELYDVTGRKISTLVNAKQSAGQYMLPINTNGQLAGGIYTVRMTANGETVSIRIIDVK